MALPDSKQLLELLQRAADQLKVAQKDAAAARAEVGTAKAEAAQARAQAREFEEKLRTAEAALIEERRRQENDDAGNVTLRPGSFAKTEFTNKTVPIARSPLADSMLRAERSMAREDGKTNVAGDDVGLLGERMKGLQDELAEQEKDRLALKDRIRALEAELSVPKDNPEQSRKLGELEHELSNTRQQLIVEQARGADLITRLQAWEARSQELEHSLASTRVAADEEHAQLDQLAGQLSQVETELTTERARTQALEEQLGTLEKGTSDEQKRLFDATSRVAQLEVEMTGLKGRRDELNIEIGKVENERNAARAKVAEVENAVATVRAKLTAEHEQAMATEHQKRTELEQTHSKEKEKHQQTAQKLLEARGKSKDLDEQLKQATARGNELHAAVEREKAAHEQSLIDLQAAHEANTATLQQQAHELAVRLETTTGEWHHVERQYEVLHRELLEVLDQRDQARSELDAIKQRLGLR